MAWVILIAAVAVVLLIAFKAQQAKDRMDLRGDDSMGEKLLVRPVAAWGAADGSRAQEKRAKQAFETLEKRVGCTNPRTRELYREALEVEGMYLPLASVYAFAVGEYVKNPQVELPTERPKTAKKTVGAVKTYFPVLYRHIKRNHNAHDAELIMLIAMNLLDYYLDREKMLEELER